MSTPDTFSEKTDTSLLIGTDKLNSILTGLALKSGLLQTKIHESRLRSDLQEIEDMALEAVILLRNLTEVM